MSVTQDGITWVPLSIKVTVMGQSHAVQDFYELCMEVHHRRTIFHGDSTLDAYLSEYDRTHRTHLGRTLRSFRNEVPQNFLTGDEWRRMVSEFVQRSISYVGSDGISRTSATIMTYEDQQHPRPDSCEAYLSARA